MTRNQFCACGHNRSLTWVDPVERRRHPNVCSVPKCECVKHDTAVTPPKAKLSVVETPAPDTTLPIDGNVLDRVLLAGALEHQNKAIEVATKHLKNGLSLSRAELHDLARGEYKAALRALGNLGAA